MKTTLVAIFFSLTLFGAELTQPILPLRVHFQYMPQSLVQWIEGDATYNFIEAYLKPREVSVVLTEKKGGRRTTYCRTEACAAEVRQQGGEAFVAAIDAQIPEKAAPGSQFGFGFRDRFGNPVLWRFVITYPSSERGAGLNQVPEMVLQYRHGGTVAGAGSAVKIGDAMHEAEMWSEISQPPYFVAYRGAYTEGMEMAEFRSGEFKPGVDQPPDVTMAGAAIRSAAWTDAGHTLRISFDPPLAAGGKSSFTVDEGRQKSVAAGEAQLRGSELRLEFRQPAWLKEKSVTNKFPAAGSN